MLFNLQEDPSETQNLAADPNHMDIAAAFYKEIAEKMDFDELRKDVIEYQQDRLLIQENNEQWPAYFLGPPTHTRCS